MAENDAENDSEESVEEKSEGLEETLKNFSSRFEKIEKRFSELEDTINILEQANIDLILIEMHSVGNNLSYAEELLRNIGTLKQFDKLRDVEKNKGVNMAYMTSKSYLESAGSDARNIMPTLKAIKNSMDKISKKLKYTGEA